MTDLGRGVGKGIGKLGSCLLSALALLAAILVAVALVVTLAVPALGAEAPTAISTIKGKAFQMAGARVASTLTRFTDPPDDQQYLDGAPAPDAPAWTDLTKVTMSTGKTPPKLLTQMRTDYPPGARGVFYGTGETPVRKDKIVFLGIQMAGKMPADSLGQQVEVGFTGKAASPVGAGTELTTWAGTQTFTLAGRFQDGGYYAAATDVSGRDPGLELAADEYYDTPSGAFGFYQPGRSTWYVVLPRAGDTAAITVSVRSTTPAGNVIDRLDLPGGGHFIDLRDPTGGYKPKSKGALISCRALETFSAESGVVTGDPGMNLVRYTAGVQNAQRAEAVLGSAIGAAGPVPVAVSEVGVDGEPMDVEGQLTVSSSGAAVSLSFEVPDGQWTFALADGLELKTPSGERIVDHTSLTGPAGVRVGPGLDGFVGGDRACLSSSSGEAEAATAGESSVPSESPAATG